MQNDHHFIRTGLFPLVSVPTIVGCVGALLIIITAIGDSGNMICVAPNEKVVAAVSAYFKPAVHDRIDFIENIPLSAINKSPLF